MMQVEQSITVKLEWDEPLQKALAQGASIGWLAKESGLAKSYVSQFVSAQRRMPLESAVKVCEAAGPEFVAMLKHAIADAAVRAAHPLKGVSE